MRNTELWKQNRFNKDSKGRIIGTHMHKIIGHAYEKIIKIHASGILVDVGCGDVPYYYIYKDIVTDNICIDWESADTVKFLDHVVDLNNGIIPLNSNSADTVLCTDVLEHISNPESLFSEMTRVLNINGKLILTVPFMYWIHTAPHDYHRYTKFKLQDFCNKNGLDVLSLEEYGGLPEIIYDLIWKGYYYYNFPFKRIFLFILRILGRFLYNRKVVKKITLQTKEFFPLGYILVAQKKQNKYKDGSI